MRFSIILVASLLTACASQPEQAHYTATPALPTVGPDGSLSCPDNDVVCGRTLTRLRIQQLQAQSNARILAIDIDTARKRLVAAKQSYQQTPDATHAEAVDEAQARLNTLIAKRGY